MLNRPLQGQVNQVVLVLGVIMVALAVIAGTLIAVAGLTVIPARIGARPPAATMLAAE